MIKSSPKPGSALVGAFLIIEVDTEMEDNAAGRVDANHSPAHTWTT
jgi:hypothetical protein